MPEKQTKVFKNLNLEFRCPSGGSSYEYGKNDAQNQKSKTFLTARCCICCKLVSTHQGPFSMQSSDK